MSSDLTGEQLVWYAGYGSNLWWDRFRCYIEGGVPPGSARPNPGARNTAAPLADAPCEIDHQLFFGDRSRTWGEGGVAYVDAKVGSGTALARRWLITTGQFSDVVAQESRKEPVSDLDLTALFEGGRQDFDGGWYDLLLRVGEHEGVPIVTITTSRPPDAVLVTPPSGAYANTLAQGLVESHGLALAEAAQYIDAATIR